MSERQSEPGRPSRIGRWLRGLAGLAALGAFSEILGRAGIVHRDFLPPASTIISRAVSLAGDDYFLTNLRSTLQAWALGFAIAVAGGVLLGLLLGSVPV